MPSVCRQVFSFSGKEAICQLDWKHSLEGDGFAIGFVG
jgi:hypothetical protein